MQNSRYLAPIAWAGIVPLSSFLLVAICVACVDAANGQSVVAPGRVSGRVLDDAGSPARAAFVTLHSSGATRPIQLPIARDGRIEGNSIPPGTYRLCVRGEAGTLTLDPCLWAERPPEVVVRSSQLTSMPDVIVESGTFLQLRVVDPGRHLGRRQVPGMLMTGIWTEKLLFYPMPGEAGPDGATSYKMVVPFGRDLTVSVGGAPVSYELAGKAAEAKQGLKEKLRLARSGGPSQTITINVLGPAAP